MWGEGDGGGGGEREERTGGKRGWGEMKSNKLERLALSLTVEAKHARLYSDLLQA